MKELIGDKFAYKLELKQANELNIGRNTIVTNFMRQIILRC